MGKFALGDVAIPKVNIKDRVTRNRVYSVVRTGTTFTRIKDNNGQEFRLTHDKFEYYFEKGGQNFILSSLADGFEYDRHMKRLACPLCDCGAWAIKDEPHSAMCTYLKDMDYAEI